MLFVFLIRADWGEADWGGADRGGADWEGADWGEANSGKTQGGYAPRNPPRLGSAECAFPGSGPGPGFSTYSARIKPRWLGVSIKASISVTSGSSPKR